MLAGTSRTLQRSITRVWEIRTTIVYRWGALFVAAGLAVSVWAQSLTTPDFGKLIQSPTAIERALEYCDNHPNYEVTLANWLMNARPGSEKDREEIRWASAHLFIDTENRQIELGLAHLLIGSPLEDLARDPGVDPVELARATSKYLMGEVSRIREFSRADRSKLDAIKAAINLQLIDAPPRETLFLYTLQHRFRFRAREDTIASTPKSVGRKHLRRIGDRRSLSKPSVGFANRSRTRHSKNRARADVPGIVR
jgi:hypothetical protein